MSSSDFVKTTESSVHRLACKSWLMTCSPSASHMNHCWAWMAMPTSLLTPCSCVNKIMVPACCAYNYTVVVTSALFLMHLARTVMILPAFHLRVGCLSAQPSLSCMTLNAEDANTVVCHRQHMEETKLSHPLQVCLDHWKSQPSVKQAMCAIHTCM